MTVRFPEGYAAVERKPRPFSFAAPGDAAEPWLECRVETAVEDGALVVKIERETHKRGTTWHAPDVFELVRDRARIAASREGRSVAARRK